MALKISVIVCAHNEALCLPSCLNSLLAQSRVPDEILVVDSCEYRCDAEALRSNVDVALTLFRNGS